MQRRPWTDEEISLLREFYPHFQTTTVAQAVGRPQDSCYRKAYELGLKKTERYLQSEASGRIARGQQHPRMVTSQFKKGLVPWNKGRAHPSSGRAAETQFKPGTRPPNWAPLGTLRINAEGYLERKVTETRQSSRDYVGVHRLVWIEAHGPVPEGCVVVFRQGQRTADLELITLDIVELVTRRELMQRNTYHRYPKEVARLVQLKGAITRQVNRIAKESR